MSTRLNAAVPSLSAVISWGVMFPVADHAIRHGLDPFNLTALRYVIAAAILLAILAGVEGTEKLRLVGRAPELLLLGAVGFAGFNLLVYVGLEHTEPQNAALVVATMPMLTLLVRWVLDGERPSGTVIALAVAALAGVALVITRGSLHTKVGSGDALVLLGALCWVLYTRGAQRFPGVSPLRYTALTAAWGAVSIVAITAVADVAGWYTVPAAGTWGDEWVAVAYIVLFGAVVGVVGWNKGVQRLGPANATLFMNLVPITAFAVRIGEGYRPVPAELAGAALTVSALVAANVVSRPAGARVGRRAEPALSEG